MKISCRAQLARVPSVAPHKTLEENRVCLQTLFSIKVVPGREHPVLPGSAAASAQVAEKILSDRIKREKFLLNHYESITPLDWQGTVEQYADKYL
jgi:hypothetical protein